MQVLMQPRNALGRQFVYQFELSGTRLHVTEDAQRAIASMVRPYSAVSRAGCWDLTASCTNDHSPSSRAIFYAWQSSSGKLHTTM